MKINSLGKELSTKLNFGCGQDFREGWLNYDVQLICHHSGKYQTAEGAVKSHADLPNKYFQEIEANMVLEHIHPDMLPTTIYWFRMWLAPEGSLNIIVPDFEVIARDFIELPKDKQAPALRLATYNLLDPQMTNSLSFHGHKSLWTEEFAKFLLHQEGFNTVACSNKGHELHIKANP